MVEIQFKFFKKKFLNYNFCNFFKKKLDQDFIVYSRFTWHTINYKSEKNLLKNLKTNKKLRYIFIEARSTKDDFYGKGKKIGKHEYVSSHYRRFIDAKDIIKKLSKFLKIIYFRESKNLAKFKKENPCVIRIIARPK